MDFTLPRHSVMTVIVVTQLFCHMTFFFSTHDFYTSRSSVQDSGLALMHAGFFTFILETRLQRKTTSIHLNAPENTQHDCSSAGKQEAGRLLCGWLVGCLVTDNTINKAGQCDYSSWMILFLFKYYRQLFFCLFCHGYIFQRWEVMM